jgi:N-acetylneuraminic acid mutarotase
MDQWRARAPMPTQRSAGAAAPIDGKIYVAGGRPPRGADFAVYDPAADQWQTLPNLPTQRNHLAAVAINGKLYVVGGRFEGGFQSQGSDSVEIYDPRTNTWTTGAPMPKPRGGVNAVEAYGCLHLFGGEFATGVHPDHDVYNPVTNTWRSLERMPIPVHGVTGMAFIDGLIYLPGGGTQQGGSSGSRIHQVYRPGMVCQ